MLHLRSDWDGIQDTRRGWVETYPSQPSSSIHEDEPVFLLRAKDPAAPQAVTAWVQAVELQGGDPELCARVRRWASEMVEWRQKNYPAPKVADVPDGVLR